MVCACDYNWSVVVDVVLKARASASIEKWCDAGCWATAIMDCMACMRRSWQLIFD